MDPSPTPTFPNSPNRGGGGGVVEKSLFEIVERLDHHCGDDLVPFLLCLVTFQ